MSAAFTPGPWHDNSGMIRTRDDNNITVRKIASTAGPFGDPESAANAQLIAAAPELYEAAEGLLVAYKAAVPHPQHNLFYTAAIAALAKARGEVA